MKDLNNVIYTCAADIGLDFDDDVLEALATAIAQSLWNQTKAPDVPHYSSWIWHVRGSLGLSQREFAKRLGTHQVTVARWETGKAKPSPVYIRLIEKVASEIADR